MDLLEVSQALSNPTRINLIQIIRDNPLSASITHQKYIENYEDKKRESIYRELENLVDASLVIKEYNSEEKKIEYRLAHKYLSVDLTETTVEPINQE